MANTNGQGGGPPIKPVIAGVAIGAAATAAAAILSDKKRRKQAAVKLTKFKKQADKTLAQAREISQTLRKEVEHAAPAANDVMNSVTSSVKKLQSSPHKAATKTKSKKPTTRKASASRQ